MRAVGARQRRQNARCRPARHLRTAHRLHQLLGQRIEQHQAPLHPAHITGALACRLALAQPMGVDQFTQQQRFLDGVKGARARLDQYLGDRLANRAWPALHQGGVCTHPLKRAHAPVAIDEHQGAALRSARSNARHQLSAFVYRLGQMPHRCHIGDARACEAQIQAMQIDLSCVPWHVQALAGHARGGGVLTVRVTEHEEVLSVHGPHPAQTPYDAASCGEPRSPRAARTSGTPRRTGVGTLRRVCRSALTAVNHPRMPVGNPDESLFRSVAPARDSGIDAEHG